VSTSPTMLQPPVVIRGQPPMRLFRDASDRLLLQIPGAGGKGGWHSIARITFAQGTASLFEFAGAITPGVDIDGNP